MKKKFFLFIAVIIVLLPAFNIIFKIQALEWSIWPAGIVLFTWLLRDCLIKLVKSRTLKRESGIKKLALCPKCRSLVLIPSASQIPRYNPPQCGEESFIDDVREFEKKHSKHRIKHLEVIFGLWRKKKENPMDPMGTTYLVGLHESTIFFIKRSRKSIEDPMTYEILKEVPPEFKWRWLLIRLLFLQ